MAENRTTCTYIRHRESLVSFNVVWALMKINLEFQCVSNIVCQFRNYLGAGDVQRVHSPTLLQHVHEVQYNMYGTL